MAAICASVSSLTPKRAGTMASVAWRTTPGLPSWSTSAAWMAVTSPTGMPRYSTVAPGWRPRTLPSKLAVEHQPLAGLADEEVLAGGGLSEGKSS